MNDLFDRLAALDPNIRERLIETLVVLAGLWMARWAVNRFLVPRLQQPDHRFRLRKVVSYTAVIAAILLVGRIWSDGLRELGAFFGLLAAGLAIALNQPLTNLAGWLFILWRRPFRIGDRVQIGNQAGDVVDLRLFQFSILEIGNWVDADQHTGRVIHIPNAMVFTTPQANYTTETHQIWNELPVMVTFESDWRGAKAILQGIVADKVQRTRQVATAGSGSDAGTYVVHRLTGDPKVITSVADSGVVLTIRYPCRPDERRTSAESLWEAILDGFATRDDIDLAYPTQRFYDNVREGKPAARAPAAGDVAAP